LLSFSWLPHSLSPFQKVKIFSFITLSLELETQVSDLFFRKIKKVFKPSNIGKVASVASLVIRDDISEVYERALGDLEKLAARDPSFGSFFRKIRKNVNPSNIGKIAGITGLAIRDEYPELSVRDLEYLEDLAARDPSLGSFFRKVKNFFSPSHIDKAANTAKEASKLAGMLTRGEGFDLSERSVTADDLQELTARDLEYFDELAARDPRFGFLRKLRKFASIGNFKKVASVASLVVREEAKSDMFERDYYSELDQLD
jgi:hypothetical protein